MRTVLIVEDVETCASTLEILFSSLEDVRVLMARNGDAALRLLEDGEQRVDAIVTDLQMAGLDGFDLIQRVRAHRRHGAVPIMVISGLSDPDTMERARRLGAGAFFAKPYSPVLVREKMEQLLRHEQD